MELEMLTIHDQLDKCRWTRLAVHGWGPSGVCCGGCAVHSPLEVTQKMGVGLSFLTCSQADFSCFMNNK